MGILDTILEGPQVISEQHDTGRINWASGLSDPGEMIACGYMPEARRISGESDQEYQKRLETMNLPAILGAERMGKLIAAANGRANLDVSTGKVALMVAGGAAAWHELGVYLDRNVTGSMAMKLASCDFQVELADSFYQFDGKLIKKALERSVIRTDTGGELGSVGNKYEPFQISELVDFAELMGGKNGAYFEVMGSLAGGAKVFILMNLAAIVEPIPGDITETYLMLSSTHDGSGAIRGFPTSKRAVCENTHRIAMKDGRGKGFSIKHTKNAKTKMIDAARMLGFARENVEQFNAAAKEMVHQPLQIQHYANDVLDAVLDITAADSIKGSDALAAALDVTQAERELAAKSFERKIKARGEVLTDILERYETGRCEPRGTAWSGFNAITESVDHGRLGGRYRGNSNERAESRFESVLLGRGDDIKQTAFEMAGV